MATSADPSSRPAGPFLLTLRRYPAHERQSTHAHDAAQVTILLRGGVREVVEGREEFGTPLCVAVKPPGVRHSDEFGPSGARTLQIAFSAPLARAWEDSLGRWRWIPGGDAVRAMLALAVHLDRGAGLDAAEDLAWEALGAIGGGRPESRAPSAVLRRVRERLDDDAAGATVRTLARDSGLHPASLTRAFRRCFGVSVVSYRTAQRFRRAAAAIAFGGSDLTRVAHEHGYSDQAHLCRDFRRRAGVTPSDYARLAGCR